MKKYPTIIISSIAIIFPMVVSASGSWALNQEGNQFSIQGECTADQVKIELFKNENDKTSAYTTDIDCKADKFSYITNFSKLDIPEGNYVIAIDEEKSQNVVAITKKNDTNIKKMTTDNLKPTTVDTPEIKFLNAFVAIQQSILDMRTWLIDTNYPTLLKNSLIVALDGVDFAVGKVSELVVSAESQDMEIDATNTDKNTISKTDEIVSELLDSKEDIQAETVVDERTETDKDNNSINNKEDDTTKAVSSDSKQKEQAEIAPNENTVETVDSHFADNTITIDTTADGLSVNDGSTAVQ